MNIHQKAAFSFSRRPHLKLPDGTMLDDLRRTDLRRQLEALGIPGISAHMGKNQLIDAFEKQFEAAKARAAKDFTDGS